MQKKIIFFYLDTGKAHISFYPQRFSNSNLFLKYLFLPQVIFLFMVRTIFTNHVNHLPPHSYLQNSMLVIIKGHQNFALLDDIWLYKHRLNYHLLCLNCGTTSLTLSNLIFKLRRNFNRSRCVELCGWLAGVCLYTK
jgi:hypothetical protein